MNARFEDEMDTRAPRLMAGGKNAGYLAASLLHFERTLELRVRAYFSATRSADRSDPTSEREPVLDDGEFCRFVTQNAVDPESRLLLMLALAPSIKPDLFDQILQKVQPGAGDFLQFGGLRGTQYRVFVPTGDPALFLLVGGVLRLEEHRS